MGITLQKLNSFFKIQVTIEPSHSLNSATNLLFRPLQHLIGQNKYQSIKGKVDHIPHQKSPSGALFSFSTVKKVMIWVGAFLAACVLTWFGMITRGLSFRSPEVNRAYTLAFLLQLPDKLFESLAPDQFPEGLYDYAETARMRTASTKPSSAALPSTAPLPIDTKSSRAPETPQKQTREVLFPEKPPEAPTIEKTPGKPESSTSTNDAILSSPSNPLTEQTREVLFPEEPPEALMIKKTPRKPAEPISLDFMQFISELADVLTTPDIDSATIERWLNSEISKEDYQFHFFMADIHLHNLYMEDSPSYNGTKNVYEMTVSKLKTFGLDRYLNENPSPQMLGSLKLADNPLLASFTQVCLLFLRPLSMELHQLTGSKEENQKTIQAWFVKTKKESQPKYSNPFFFAPYVLLRNRNGLLKGILDEDALKELSDLYTNCRTRLLALDLKEYVEEKTT
jgi:hypothetical protein